MKRIFEENVNTKEHWDMVYGQDLYTKGVDDVKYQYIAQHIINGTRVMDLGCGNGDFLKAVHDRNPKCHLYGIDHSEEGIKTATKQLLSTGTTLYTGDLYNTAIEASFDYITALEVLEHMSAPEFLIKGMFQLLKEGGTAFLTTPYLDHIPSGEHFWEFDYDDVRLMFRTTGFSKVWVFPYASGRSVLNDDETVQYPRGNLDEIFVLAIK